MGNLAPEVTSARVSAAAAGKPLKGLVAVPEPDAAPCNWVLEPAAGQAGAVELQVHPTERVRATELYLLEPEPYQKRFLVVDTAAVDVTDADEVGDELMDAQCDECSSFSRDGEGWDGLCGDCADKAETEGRWG